MNSRIAPTAGVVILGIVSVAFLAGCGGSTSTAVTANNQPPPPLPQATAVTVVPASVMIPPGGIQQFAAAVSPSGANQAVTWTVSGTGCTGGGCGTIGANGKYTAPGIIANPLTVTVKAISIADPSKFAVGTVTIEASVNNPMLSGQYALLSGGFAGAIPVAVVGSFTADGNGHLLSGSMDVTWGNAVYRRNLSNSTYSVGSDNRGTMNLVFATALGPDLGFTFSFTLDSSSPAGLATEGRLIDSSVTGESGTGFFVKQDSAAFSTAAINGGYAFGLAGPQGINEIVALGRFTADNGTA